MGLTLLSITIGVALIMGTVYTSYWLPYCLVLILLGGLLVIFIYVSLLASNETFRLSAPAILAAPMVSMIGGFTYSISYIDVGIAPALTTLSIRGSRDLTIYDAFTPLYSSELNSLTIFVVLYLLLRLLVVVFNTKSRTSTLRSQKN